MELQCSDEIFHMNIISIQALIGQADEILIFATVQTLMCRMASL